MSPEVIVVGLGAHGAATLLQLARRGVPALGIDRWAPPHAMGSSHGETRATRQGVGEGEDFAPLALRSHEIWRELEESSGELLLVACGMLFISSGLGGQVHGTGDFIGASAAVARRFGVPHELLDAAEVGHRFPQFQLQGDERAYYEPGGGYVHPERCIAVQLAEAQRLGARVITGVRVGSVEEDAHGVRVEAGGTAHAAERAVVTAGAWTHELAPDGLPGVAVQPQMLHWFPCDDPHAYAPDRTPVFNWMHGEEADDTFYGFPIPSDSQTGCVKVATEATAAIASADRLDRTPPPGAGEALFDRHLDGRLRGLRREAVKSVVCVYATSPGAEFRVVASRAQGRILAVSACSGHAFKHSAAFGERLAEMALSGGRDWRAARPPGTLAAPAARS